MLGEKIEKHNVNVFLVNTGWTGGEYGVGKRMNLAYTRAMVNAALEGDLNNVETIQDEFFGLAIPQHVPGVPDQVLIPSLTWADKASYENKALELVNKFKENFKKFEGFDSQLSNLGGPLK
jgi:phosphoenolpyruvate carboxykinase (ATP)